MKTSRTLCAAGLAACALTACGGGGYGGGGSYMGGGTMTGMAYGMTSLVANAGAGIYGARYNDVNLVDAWGLAFDPGGFAWVADRASAMLTHYDGNGIAQTPAIATPAQPTGLVFNTAADFMVTQNTTTGASTAIVATKGGLLAALAPSVDATHALTVYDGSAGARQYTGLALAAQGSANFLYAADFHNAHVDVFDHTFAPAAAAGGFADAALPAGYAPYGIQTIGNRIYIAYAKQDVTASSAVVGAGLGVVDVFDTTGTLVKQLIAGSMLNAPWGMALAPATFGRFANDLLVANFGDGRVNAFDPSTGAYLGTVMQTSGTPITVGGLWGIAFGNGLNNQPTSTLFLSAGPGSGTQGLFARIDVQ